MHVLPLSVVAGNHEWVPTLLKHYIDGFILIIGIPRSPKRISISSCADCPISDAHDGVSWRRRVKSWAWMTVETTETTLRWRDWTRYSSRQHRKMQLGGLVGSV